MTGILFLSCEIVPNPYSFTFQLSTMLIAMKGLPSTYNKDLQESQESMFDTYENMYCLLNVALGVMTTLTVWRVMCVWGGRGVVGQGRIKCTTANQSLEVNRS